MNEGTSLETLFWQIATKDDTEALKKIFFEFYPALCVFAERYINCSETCRDIVQETFFKIWKNRKQIEISSSFRNFLITSVRNACTDYLRREKMTTYMEQKASKKFFPASPEDIYTLNELHQKINEALEKLPENSRQAFELHRFQDMTYTQIADEMHISVKTVESYISKALKILRVELKDFLPFLILFL